MRDDRPTRAREATSADLVTSSGKNPGSNTTGSAGVDFGGGCFGLSLLDPELELSLAVYLGGAVVD